MTSNPLPQAGAGQALGDYQSVGHTLAVHGLVAGKGLVNRFSDKPGSGFMKFFWVHFKILHKNQSKLVGVNSRRDAYAEGVCRLPERKAGSRVAEQVMSGALHYFHSRYRTSHISFAKAFRDFASIKNINTSIPRLGLIPMRSFQCRRRYQDEHEQWNCKYFRHSRLSLKPKPRTTGLKSQPINARLSVLSSKIYQPDLAVRTLGAQAPRYFQALYLCLHSWVYREVERLAGFLVYLSANLVHPALSRLAAHLAGFTRTTLGAAS